MILLVGYTLHGKEGNRNKRKIGCQMRLMSKRLQYFIYVSHIALSMTIPYSFLNIDSIVHKDNLCGDSKMFCDTTALCQTLIMCTRTLIITCHCEESEESDKIIRVRAMWLRSSSGNKT